LRVGADAFASDLNPIPVLLNKVVLEYIPKHGQALVTVVEQLCCQIEIQAKAILTPFFPKEKKGTIPLAYIWARTVLSEAPSGGNIPIEIPLISSMWLSKKPHRRRALRWKRDDHNSIVITDVAIRVVPRDKFNHFNAF
jgi:putative DNA methylase